MFHINMIFIFIIIRILIFFCIPIIFWISLVKQDNESPLPRVFG